MINYMEKAPNKSIFLLHGCEHNPTGTHLTEKQWKEVYEVIKKTKKNNIYQFIICLIKILCKVS